MQSTPDLRAKHLPLLASLAPFSWDPEKTVSMFGVVMRNSYYIIVIGNSARPATTGQQAPPDIIRVLYVSENVIFDTELEQIQVYREGSHYVLHVSSNKDSFGTAYSGAPLPLPHCTVITPHFLEEDAWHDTFIIKESSHGTMPTGYITTPNAALAISTSFAAYFPPGVITVGGDVLDYGHHIRSHYVVPKHTVWESYGLRGLQGEDSHNEIFFGGGKYMDIAGSYFSMIYEDRSYDDTNALFPSTFAGACNMDWRSQNTKHVDAFFRRLHQSKDRVLFNAQSVTCTLPLACRVRPFGTLSFMRHVVLFPLYIADVGAVDITAGAAKLGLSGRYLNCLRRFLPRYSAFLPSLRLFPSDDEFLEANSSVVTLPLPGFSSFSHRFFKPPPVSDMEDPFWEFVRAIYTDPSDDFRECDSAILCQTERSGSDPASPFTRLVDEILRFRNRETQLMFLRVIWLDKLLMWKMRTFGRSVYLTRVAVPMLILFVIQIVVSILLTRSNDSSVASITTPIVALVCAEAALAAYILLTKVRQATYYILPCRLEEVSAKGIPSFLNTASLDRGPSNAEGLRSNRHVAALADGNVALSRTFSGYTRLIVLVSLRFTFVPFLLLRNIDATDKVPFSNFGLSISEMIKFTASDYGALEKWEVSSAAARTLRALYTIVITILLLNTLIALLNLKVKSADKRPRLLWLRQMAALQCEIELGLLGRWERARRDWFPEWFTCRMSKGEKQEWTAHLEQSPLRWTKENNFDANKDHGPRARREQAQQRDNSAVEATAASGRGNNDDNDDLDLKESAESHTASNASDAEAIPPGTPLLYINGEPAVIADETIAEQLQTQTDDSSPPTEAGEASDRTVSQQRTTGSSTPEPPADSQKACVVCSAPGKLCTGCRKIAYCGVEHQRSDWKTHKSICKGKQKA
ncbi:hypothetical protein FQN49_004410 [Arthroderma sp. PD_2]|nr:hypothetical protein FQN49_004410 [Arthroderma sp. PD_2]